MSSVIGQFFKNVLTTYASVVISLLITFFFTPYLISMLGKVEYGVWTLMFSIVAYMELADLGMRQSLVRNISKYLATEDWPQLNQVFSSSVLIYFFVGAIIQVATLIVTFFFLDSFQIPVDLMNVAKACLLVLGTNQAVSFMVIPFASMGPYHRFDINVYFTLPTRIVQTVGVIFLLEYGLGLLEMAFLVMAMSFLSRFGLHLARRRMFPKVRFSFKYITKDKTRELINYAMYSFLIVAMLMIIYQTDNIIIGRFISMEAVSVFSIGAALIAQLRSIVYNISVPLVPTISHFEAEKRFDRIVSVYDRSTNYLYYLAGLLTVCTFAFGGPFVLLWVGDDFTESITILYLLIVPAAINFPQLIANSVLFGISRHKIIFYVLAAEAVAKIILSLILVKYWGIVGVAIGTAVPQLIIYSVVYPIAFYRELKTPVSQFYKTASRSLLYSAIICIPPAWLMYHFLRPDTWLNFLIGGCFTALVAAVGFYRLLLDADDKKRLIEKLRSIIMKMTGKRE
jgi:O-antigen/teichoic acid export membrane protein